MALEIQNLSFAYALKPVFEDLNFRLDYGQIHALLGRNGAGKSTLFKLILGFLKAQEGTILLDGKNLSDYGPRELARKIAFIPQKQSGSFPYTVWEMVLMGTNPQISLFAQPGHKEKQQAENALRSLGLESFRLRRYDLLSGGEQQLVLIARALAQQSRILILDEPTSELDLGRRVEVMQRLKMLASEGYMVVLSTHNPQQVLSYADHVLILNAGTLDGDGAPESILTAAKLSELYSIPVRLIHGEQGETALITDRV